MELYHGFELEKIGYKQMCLRIESASLVTVKPKCDQAVNCNVPYISAVIIYGYNSGRQISH